MKLEIRKELPSDYQETDAMVRRAFFNKFKPGAEETLLMQKLRPHPDYLPEFSRVAVLDERIVGGIFYSRAWIVTDTEKTEIVTFGPLCVDHAMKNHGIGGMLLRETLPLVKAAGYPGVALVGEKDYYPKFGFRRGRELGLTDEWGNTFDPFMVLELRENGLHIPGGRYVYSSAFNDFPQAEIDALDAKMEFIAKVHRPCQWSYEDAEDEKQGYRLEYAVTHPALFDTLWHEYIGYLSGFDQAILPHEGEMLSSLRSRVSAASYVIFEKDMPIGLFVCSGPESREEDCVIYMEEIYLKPAYRGRGRGKDILLRLWRHQEGNMGFCVFKNNRQAIAVWEHILTNAGIPFEKNEYKEKWWFYKMLK